MVEKEFAQKMKEDLYYWIMGGYEKHQAKVDNMIKEIEDKHNIKFVIINGHRTLILDKD